SHSNKPHRGTRDAGPDSPAPHALSLRAHDFCGSRSRFVPFEARFELVRSFNARQSPLAAAVGQGEDEQRSTKRRVLRQISVTADRAEPFRRFGESGGHTDAGPSADAGVSADVLLPVVL